MAHEITINQTTGKAEAYYGSAAPAWHGLGTVVPGTVTSREAMELAGLGWEVEQQDMTRTNNDGSRTLIETHVCNVRSDNGEQLGVVGRDYRPVQNREAFTFFDDLVGDRLAMYESAGSLKGGKRVWILAKIPKTYYVSAEDKWEPYVLMANGHDGTMGFRIMPTAVRVVCWNTLSIALSRAAASKVGVMFRHTKGITERVKEAREALGLMVTQFDAMDEAFHRFIEKPLTVDQGTDYFADVLRRTDAIAKVDDDAKDSEPKNSLKTLLDLWQNDNHNLIGGMGRTLWGAMNAVTQWVDHERGGRGESENDQDRSRLDSAWFGVGATYKSRAYAKALAIVGK